MKKGLAWQDLFFGGERLASRAVSLGDVIVGFAQFVQQGAALITNQKTRGVVSLGRQQSEKYRCLMLEGYK